MKKSKISEYLLKTKNENLDNALDEYGLKWGTILNVGSLDGLDLPFGRHTAYNIHKGHYVGKKSLVQALEHFGIPYEIDSGFIDRPLSELL